MRQNLILIVSIGVNAALLVALLGSKPRVKPPLAQITNAVSATNAVKTVIVVRKQFFTWQELESPDYPAYVKNLRDIGCPEQTIRDIIIADLGQLFAKRRATEVPTPDQQWWRTPPDATFLQMAQAKADALEQERRDMLAKLLGPNWNAGEKQLNNLVSLNGPLLGDLSPDARSMVHDIVAHTQTRSKAYLDAQRDAGKLSDPAELARINQTMRSELAQVLNPAQMEEFLLRYSQNAAALRDQLKGIDITADEFRNLFRISDPIEQQIQLATGDEASRAAQQQSLAKQLIEALKNVLGPDRYQAYRMAQDPAFASAVNQANDAGAPAEAVQPLYQFNKLITQERNRILNDPTLTPDQRTAQLQALDKQQQVTSDQLLGITPPPEPPTPPPLPTTLPPVAVHAYAPGETLDQIAAQFNITINALVNANPGLNFQNLSRGTPINIPRGQ